MGPKNDEKQAQKTKKKFIMRRNYKRTRGHKRSVYKYSLHVNNREIDQDEQLTIGSCLACVHRVMDARGKFGEHERSVRVARGAAESNSSFLSALQTSQVHP